jgi:hypothetical protein
MSSARGSARDGASVALGSSSARAAGPVTGRSQGPQATDRTLPLDSFRSTMSTGRVHTALAALNAERDALKSKLAFIDAQLESESKKKAHQKR